MRFFFVLFTILAVAFVTVRAAADKSVCSQPRETGPCRGSAENFYYNSEAKECQSFIYGGCKGNDNRFASKEECEKRCL